MLCSFGAAAETGLDAATLTRPAAAERLAPWADAWLTSVQNVFLRAYLAVARGVLPADGEDLDTLLVACLLDRACEELARELRGRSGRAHVPLAGLLRLRA